MKIEDVKERIKEIKAEIYDPEVAHSKEDKLYFDLLWAIAKGKVENPQELAKEVIKTSRLDFPRWCA